MTRLRRTRREEEKKLVAPLFPVAVGLFPLLSPSPRAPHDFYDGICLSLEKGKPTRACVHVKLNVDEWHLVEYTWKTGNFSRQEGGGGRDDFSFPRLPLSMCHSPFAFLLNPFSPPVIPLCISFFSPEFSTLSLSLSLSHSSLLENVLPTCP